MLVSALTGVFAFSLLAPAGEASPASKPTPPATRGLVVAANPLAFVRPQPDDAKAQAGPGDVVINEVERKSTRLTSSHGM